MTRKHKAPSQARMPSTRAERRQAERHLPSSQQRTTTRRGRFRGPARGVALLAGGGLLTVAIVAALILTSAPVGLPGLQTGPPPWSANATQLRGRLASIGLAPQTMEGQALHTHQHLDLFVDAKPVAVPERKPEPPFEQKHRGAA